jgi:hypothetical protein
MAPIKRMIVRSDTTGGFTPLAAPGPANGFSEESTRSS